MSFEEVLGNCLAELEQGSSVEACLAHYPAYTAELEPILRLITPMRSGPKPRLSTRAFARGRAAVAAYARQQQQLREPFNAASPRAAQTRSFYAPSTPQPGVKAAQVKLPSPPPPARAYRQLHVWMRVLVVLLLVITFASFVRGVATSLPGSLLYPLKGWGENAQGLIMTASGQQPSWHVNQLTRRLTEFALLAQQGRQIAPALTTAIDEHLQAALDGSSTLSPEQRQQFLATWLADLHTLQQELPAQAATVATLSRTIMAVEQATQANSGPTILPVESTPTNTPVPTDTATLVSLPTVTPTETETPSPTATLAIPTPTSDNSLVVTPVVEATASPTPFIVEATATPMPLVETPTFTPSPQLMPEEKDDGGSDSSDRKSSQLTPTAPPATDTPLATVPAPHIPLPTGEVTGESETPTSETPTAPIETPVPGGIPTSAEPPTPAPTETSKGPATPSATKPAEATATKQPEATPTPKAATPTPNRNDNKTSTPEPTKAENGAPTNTPKPEETKAETPPPDDDAAVTAGTPEPSDDAEEATPAPTPTKKKKK